jgi:L-2-hydroxyglutarate oxidase LhgO
MSQGSVAVIGAGVIGAAVFRAFAQKGYETILLERHPHACEETSSRNSGVLHAGIYYPQKSLKTKLCVQGNRLFREFAEAKNIPFWDCGKLIVGPKSDDEEIQKLFKQAQQNGVPECRLLSQADIKKMEPDIAADVGIFSPTSALIDPHLFVDALLAEGIDAGGMIVYDCNVQGIDPQGSAFMVQTNRDKLEVDFIVNAGGLNAIQIAHMVNHKKHTYHFCRGDYFALQGSKILINHLIYPTPDHTHHSLGVHITPDHNGRIRLGPDARYINDPYQVIDGADETAKQIFFEGAKRLLPHLKLSDLSYDMWGIRPKLNPPGSADFYDFVIEEYPKGVIHLIGIESPGLTASMAIGDYVLEQFF